MRCVRVGKRSIRVVLDGHGWKDVGRSEDVFRGDAEVGATEHAV